MPIKQLQQRLSQVGVIRLGEKRTSKNGRGYTAKLETFRLTSPSRSVIEKAARLFGGEVQDWPDGPSGPEFQVVTNVTELPVYVLPQRIDPNLELWGRGHKIRHCDGVTERIRNIPCMCESAARARYEQAGIPWPEDGRFIRGENDCKPTTRISVVIADVSDRQWKLESHGWNAAAELPTAATVYLAMANRPVPAILRLDQRQQRKLIIDGGQERVESRKFAVPVLDFDGSFTARQALTGGLNEAIDRVLASRQQVAISSGPADQEDQEKLTADEVIRLAGFTKDIAQLQALWKDASRDGALTDEVKTVLENRAADLKPQPAVEKPANTPAAADVVPADVDEPDPDDLWMRIQAAAGKRKWNADDLEQRIIARFNKPSDEINGWQMQTFLDEVENGQIQ